MKTCARSAIPNSIRSRNSMAERANSCSDLAVEKQVATRFPVIPVLLNRWSPRSFIGEMPPSGQLGSLFEAARLAPSAHNSQPVRFLLGRKGMGDTWDRLFGCLSEDNQAWASAAPVLILASVMRERFSQDRGDFVPYPHAMHDLGLAVMSLIVQAHAMDLHAHPMAAFEPDQAQAEFHIPTLFAPAMMIAVGYRGRPDLLPSSLGARERGPRVRRALEEIVFEDDWGLASSLFAARGS